MILIWTKTLIQLQMRGILNQTKTVILIQSKVVQVHNKKEGKDWASQGQHVNHQYQKKMRQSVKSSNSHGTSLSKQTGRKQPKALTGKAKENIGTLANIAVAYLIFFV